MEERVFQRFRDIVLTESGISLGAEKRSLLLNRISKRMHQLQVPSEGDYLEIIETDASGTELRYLIEAISTNVTYFWREAKHFEVFRKALAVLLRQQQEVKVWCAASSSGEEPFCLAAVAHQILSENRRPLNTVKILATDIAIKVLSFAQDAQYDPRQLRDTPAEIVNRYFPVHSTPHGERVIIDPELREMVTFKKLNLAQFPYPLKGGIDFIFCRNVMIYFNGQLRQQIVSEFERLLRPGGMLTISLSENLMGLRHSLKSISAGVYQKC